MPTKTLHPVRAWGSLLALSFGLALGCSGLIDDPAAGPSGSPRPGMPPDDTRIPTRVWRLSPTQFNEEVQRLLGEGAPPVAIPESASERGLSSIAATALIDVGNASLFVDGARAVGTWAAAQGGSVSRCSDHGSDACIDSFLAWFPASAFRRSVAESELSDLRTLFNGLRAGYDYDYAFAGLVRAVLLSPEFLYRTELGSDADRDRTVLGQFEIANLLAFAITDGGPDMALLDAAVAGRLTDAEERERHARRLMGQSERMWQRFFWEWLHMSTLRSQGAEVGLDPMIVTQMEEEYAAFVTGVVVTERGSLRELLSAPYTYARPELAALYGATHPGSGLARIDLDPTQRGGLLTQGAWLVAHGKRGRDNVVRRGMGIYVLALCNDITVPPGLDVEAELARLVGPDATVRETVEARGSAGTCAGCHRIADPVGLVFEHYASTGAWQTTYADGRPVDTATTLEGIGSFDDAPSLSAAFADDPTFQTCFVRRLAHSMVGYDIGTPARIDWTRSAQARFREADTSLEELVVALVRHPVFIERRRGGE